MTENISGGVHRRTVVAGAAWTIPVVATAIGAPLAAASTTAPTLAFTNGPYTVAACGTLKDVVIAATTDGSTPVAAGTPITVTLPGGLAWPDGTTGAKTVPTDAGGIVVLTGITASGTSGTRTIGATSGASSTSTPVAVSSSGPTFLWDTNTNSVRPAGAPAGSTPIAWNMFIDPSGTLWVGGAQRASGLDPATTVTTTNDNSQTISWIDTTTGQAYQWLITANASPSAVPAPAGSRFLTWNSYVDPAGNLWVNGTQRASGLDPEKTWAGSTDSAQLFGWADQATGRTFLWDTTTRSVRPAGAPAGSTPIAWNMFIDPSGGLWVNGAQRASGLDPATTVTTTNDNSQTISWIDTTTGQAYQWLITANASPSPVPAPAGSRFLTWNSYVDPAGNLWVNGTQRASALDPEKTWAGSTDSAQLFGWASASC